MDTAHLRTFLEIYYLRHFGKAAEKLFITQSAASARIKLLEERLGVQLFERSHHNVTPTLAGKRFLKYAETMVASWEQARQVVGLPEDYRQSLSIGCQPDAWRFFLQDCFGRMREQMAGVAFSLGNFSGAEVVEQVIAGRLDMGLVFEPAHLPVLRHAPLAELELVLLSTAADMAVEDIPDANYLLVDWGEVFLREHAQFFRAHPVPVFMVNTGGMALGILQNTAGAAYLPRYLAANSERFHVVADMPVFRHTVFAVYREDTANREQIDRLLAILGHYGEKRFFS